MAALEMVMNERLTERAFDILFENPPEVLAALKGSPKLADLKSQPGRAPVQASGAGDIASTSEQGLKNAEIEAIEGGTQAIDPQRDRAPNPDPDGEKRSQLRDQDSLSHGGNTIGTRIREFKRNRV
jgi:hypothetical protein